MLKVEDLNIVIKYFAEKISHLIQSLTLKNYHRNPINTLNNKQKSIQLIESNNDTGSVNSGTNDLQQQVEQLCKIYHDYRLNCLQVELVRKMGYRLQQIFTFFRMQSKHQGLLIHTQRQIINKFNIMINESKPNIGSIIDYIRRVCLKDIGEHGILSDKDHQKQQISITNKKDNDNHHNDLVTNMGGIQHYSSYSHSHLNIPVFPTTSTNKNQGQRKTFTRFSSRNSNHQSKICKGVHSRRKIKSVAIQMHPISKNQKQEEINQVCKLYSCMKDIDKNHLSKLIQKERDKIFSDRNLIKNFSYSKRNYQGQNNVSLIKKTFKSNQNIRRVHTQLQFADNKKKSQKQNTIIQDSKVLTQLKLASNCTNYEQTQIKKLQKNKKSKQSTNVTTWAASRRGLGTANKNKRNLRNRQLYNQNIMF